MIRKVCFNFLLIIVSGMGCIINPGESEQSLDLHPGVNDIRIKHDGLERELIIQLPLNYRDENIYPVLFFFHGLGGTTGMGKAYIGPLVDSEQFIGIYPQGIENSWNTGAGEVPSTANDVGFTLEILRLIGKEVKIDDKRIYSMGYSNGGAFSYTLALRTDKFASIVSISASLFEGLTIDPGVAKLSVCQMHGELDRKVPYHGGKSSALTISFESAQSTVKMWAVHNGITGDPVIEKQEDMLTVYRYTMEDNPYEAALYCLNETTHHIITHPFVSSNRCYKEAWDFLKRHPKKEEE